MRIEFGIFSSLFLLGISILFIYSGIKRKTNRLRLKILGVFGIILGILSMNSVLFVIAPRVPGELKDGLFGASGGILLSSAIMNVAIGGFTLGLFLLAKCFPKKYFETSESLLDKEIQKG